MYYDGIDAQIMGELTHERVSAWLKSIASVWDKGGWAMHPWLSGIYLIPP